ncbi:hypothetical protein M4I21_01560 [Cellulophaga sp. 20_2_10]|uniref:hypothetical protein n=1 Tax=Cellulophaga sp. 20_2_10 TaxID=2942476 RepID=UPI00201A3A30|nr:hypothetical protein [Cellulophaga sp. 20_2_10]MCL5244474.1 hypothetical protein [Cellulophaga sp. 20_2_10]
MESIKLTFANLINELQKDHLIDRKIVVEEEVRIDSSNFNWDVRIIENVTFDKLLFFRDVDIKSGLIFKNCIFKSGVTFNNVISSDSQINISPYNTTIVFENCVGSKLVITNKCNFKRGIKIENNSEFEVISVLHSKIEQGLKIEESRIKELLDICNCNLELRLNKVKVLKNIRITSFKGDIALIYCEVDSWVKFWNVECPNSFTLNDNIFNGDFIIEGSRLNGLFIHRDTFNKKVTLENRDRSSNNNNNEAYCNEIYITEAKFIEGVDFNGLGKLIEKITLSITPNLQGVIKISGWKVGKLNISGVNQNLKLILSQLELKRLIIIEFTNYNDITFERCEADNTNFKTDLVPKSSMLLAHADLGKTKFIEFNFNSFDFIEINNSSFNEIYTSNVDWFNEDKLQIQDRLGDQLKIAKRKREVYRQLKQSLIRNGNQIDSLTFKARELKAYREELNKLGKKYSCWDRIIMTVNQTNNYGLSWWKPTWIIFFITLFFYFIMVPIFSTEMDYAIASNWDEVKTTFSEFYINFEVFWKLFNPTRKFTSTYGNLDSALLHFLDLFHRIILGVFIFQIIKGFRKLSTK